MDPPCLCNRARLPREFQALFQSDAGGRVLAFPDAGCARTMRGSTRGRSFERQLARRGLRSTAVEAHGAFKGVGGRAKRSRTVAFPVVAGGCLGEITPSEVDEVPDRVDRDYPMLLSKHVPTKPDGAARLDSEEAAVEFTARCVHGL